MKKSISTLLLCLMAAALCACGASQEPAPAVEPSSSQTEQASSMEESSSVEQSEPAESSNPPSANQTPPASPEEEPGSTARQISVQFGENTVVYELNDGTAADSLYEQLPLTIEVEDYSTNEKIFYPPEELDTSDSPLAQAGAGTLAYYAPWGDVVMFYGDYNQNSSLYELGQIVSGGELVSQMSGTITVTAV